MRPQNQLFDEMPKPAPSLAALLKGGDRRSIGHSNAIAALIAQRSERFRELIACLWSDDPLVRMRAADAAEKVSARRPELLKPFKRELLGLAVETDQQELRWHLAQMIPRMPLTGGERMRAAAAFRSFLTDRSSIVKTCAMQALVDLAGQDTELRTETAARIEELVRTGTPAMKARGRKLLKQLRRNPVAR
jgi:hypothetical protein